MKKNKIGSIVWSDLTVDQAEKVRDFYVSVVGWTFEPVKQDGYNDFNMKDQEGSVITGICHRRGANEKIPPQWLMYITVNDLSVSIQNCEKLGGKVVDRPKKFGEQQFAIIQDPAGAIVALYQE